jgi:hypothetical protein
MEAVKHEVQCRVPTIIEAPPHEKTRFNPRDPSRVALRRATAHDAATADQQSSVTNAGTPSVARSRLIARSE